MRPIFIDSDPFRNDLRIIYIISYRTNTKVSTIAKRLGPPAAKLFAQEKEAKAVPLIVTKKNVFSRLGEEIPQIPASVC